MEKTYLASFDIGKKNFAFCVEEVDTASLEEIENIPQKERYNPDGTKTAEFKTIMDRVYQTGRLVLFKNTDLTVGVVKKEGKGKLYLDIEVFHNMVDLLDEYRDYWLRCSVIVIEKQMRCNNMAQRLGQHCASYFIVSHGRFKSVIEFPSYYKTQILGAAKIKTTTKAGKVRYKAVDKKVRKKWSVDVAIEILEDRDELGWMNEIKTKKKKDDLGDVVCQLQAFKYLYFVEKMDF